MPARGLRAGRNRVTRAKAKVPSPAVKSAAPGRMSEVLEGLAPSGGGLAGFGSALGWGLLGMSAVDSLSGFLNEAIYGTGRRSLELAEKGQAAEQEANRRMLGFYEREEARAARDAEEEKIAEYLREREQRQLASLEARNQPYRDVLDEILEASPDEYAVARGEALDSLMMQLSALQAQDKAAHPLQIMGINL